MKNKFKKAAYAIGIMALSIAGCQKEKLNLNPSQIEVYESEIQALVIQTETESETPEIIFNEVTQEFTALNEGIAVDYLVIDENLNAGNEGDSMPKLGANPNQLDNSFIRCLKELKLDDDQAKKIRIALGEYKDCKASAIKRARAIHADLVAKYKELAAEQHKLLRAGKITKEEYEARIARIRAAFKKELRELQLKEKLNEALKNCYTKLLRQLNGILTERQWKAFVACHKK